MVIDNTNLLNLCRDCGAGDFVPALNYEYDAVAKTVTVIDASTYDAADDLSIIKVKVHDFFGNEVRGTIALPAGNVEINVETLNRSKPLSITATILTVGHVAADGSASGYLDTNGSLAFFDVQKNA